MQRTGERLSLSAPASLSRRPHGFIDNSPLATQVSVSAPKNNPVM
jgi:hypothetical protein